MKIKSLKTVNFKGGSFSHEFGDINLIVGKNFTLKSAIPQAIEVANYGALLSVGETNSATFRLSSDASELFTRVTFDDGSTNTFALSKDASGSIKSSYERAHDFPRVLIDIEEYFGLSEQERLKYVLKRANLKKCGYVESELHAALFPKEKRSKTQDMIFVHWDREWWKAVQECRETGSSVMDFMDALLLRLKKHASAVTAKLKLAKQSAKQIELSTEQPEDVSDLRNKAYENLTDARNALKIEVDSALEDLESDLAHSEDEADTQEDVIKSLNNEEQRMRKLKSCPTCKAEGVDWLKPWMKQHSAKVADAVHELEKANAEITKLKREIASKKKKPVNNEAAQKAIDQAQKRFDELDAKYEDFIKWQGEQERHEKLKTEIAELTVEDIMLSAMVKALVEYQRDLVDKAFKALLQTASQFTTTLIEGDLIYQDGHLGYKRGKRFVHHSVLSGTEKLMTYVGLQIALAQESPCKYIVLDEMGRVHALLKDFIMSRLKALLRNGILDQAFLIDVSVNDYAKDKSVQLINL